MSSEDVSKRITKAIAGFRAALDETLLAKSREGSRDTLSRYEFRSAIQECETGLSFADIGALMNLLDPDNSGEISVSKFWQKAEQEFHIPKRAGDILSSSAQKSSQLSASDLLRKQQSKGGSAGGERTRFAAASDTAATSPVSRFFAMAGTKLPDYTKVAASSTSADSLKDVVSPTLSNVSSSSSAGGGKKTGLSHTGRLFSGETPTSQSTQEFAMPSFTQAQLQTEQQRPQRLSSAAFSTLGKATSPTRYSTPNLSRASENNDAASSGFGMGNTSERARGSHEKATFDEKEAQLSHLTSQNELLMNELKLLREGKAEYEAKMGPLLGELNDKKRQLAQQNQDLDKKLSLREEEMKQAVYEKEKIFRGQVERLQQKLDDVARTKKTGVSPDSTPLADLQTKLKAETSKAEALDARVQELERSIRSETTRRERAEENLRQNLVGKVTSAGQDGEILSLGEEVAALQAALGAEKEARLMLEKGFTEARETLWTEREDKEILEAELVVLRSEVSTARSMLSDAAEVPLLREEVARLKAQLEAESAARTKAQADTEAIRASLVASKEEVIVIQEDERSRAEELMERERRLLLTLMKQLQSTQQEQLRLDDYCEEMDKVYGSLEKLYTSLKNEDGPSLTQIVEETKPGRDSSVGPREQEAASTYQKGAEEKGAGTAQIVGDLNSLRSEMQMLLNS